MDDLVEIKSLIGDVNTAFEELKKTNDENLKSRDALLEEKLSKINDSIDDAMGKLEAVQKDLSRQKLNASSTDKKDVMKDLTSLINTKRLEGAGERSPILKTEDAKWLQEKGYQVNIPDQGGYLVQPEFGGVFEGVVREISPIRAISSVTTTSSDRFHLISYNKGTNSRKSGETETRTETQIAQFNRIEIPVHEIYAYVFCTNKMLEDAGFDFGAWLVGEAVDDFAEDEGFDFVNGDGVATARGILTYAHTAQTYEFNKIQRVASGGDTTLTADNIIALFYALKQQYRANSTFLMNKQTLRTIRQLKENGANGQYLWQPSLQSGQPSTLLGQPVVEVAAMPDVGAGNLPVAVGDFRRAYQIVDRLGLRIIRDDVTTPGLTKFYIYRRFGGGVKQFDSVKLLRTSASAT